MARLSKAVIILHVVYGVLAILPLVLFFIVLPLLPEMVAVHFGASGQPDRFGSKFELVFLPLVSIGFAILLYFIVRASGTRSKNPRRSLSTGLIIICGALLIIDAIAVWILGSNVTQFQSIFNGNLLNSYIFSLLGIELILIGFLTPRLSINPWSGVRVPWELSEQAWGNLQRFGGKLSIGAGIILFIASSLWLRGTSVLILFIVLAAILVVAVLVYGYKLRIR